MKSPSLLTLISLALAVVMLGVISFLMLERFGNNGTFNSFNVTTPTSVTIDANQRAIISTSRTEASDGNLSAIAYTRYIVCAEPNPDALVATAGSLSTEQEGDFGDAATIMASLFSEYEQSVNKLGNRNDTIQLLRDGLFRTCEAYQNRAIDETEYSLLANKYANIMVILLAIEKLTSNLSLSTVSQSSGIENRDLLALPAVGKLDNEGLKILTETVENLVQTSVLEDRERVLTRRCLVFLTSPKSDAQHPFTKFCLEQLGNISSTNSVRDNNSRPEFDPSQSAILLNIGDDPKIVSISTADSVKWLSFNISAQSNYLITAASISSGLDTKISLFIKNDDQENVFFAENDDVGNEVYELTMGLKSTDSVLMSSLPAGDYLLAVQAYSPTQAGEVRVRVQSQDAIEYALDSESARPLTIDSDWSPVTLSQSGQSGLYFIEPQDQGRYRFEARSDGLDVKLFILRFEGSSWELIGENDDANLSPNDYLGQRDSRLSLALTEGRYYLLVKSLNQNLGLADVRVERLDQ